MRITSRYLDELVKVIGTLNYRLVRAQRELGTERSRVSGLEDAILGIRDALKEVEKERRKVEDRPAGSDTAKELLVERLQELKMFLGELKKKEGGESILIRVNRAGTLGQVGGDCSHSNK